MRSNCTCLEAWQKTMLSNGCVVSAKKISFRRNTDGQIVYGVNVACGTGSEQPLAYLHFNYCPICGSKFKEE